MNIWPEPGIRSSAGRMSGRFGLQQPSYHVRVTGGRLPRAGNLYVTTEPFGQEYSLPPMTSDETCVGAPSSRPQKAASIVWQPMSPIAPEP